MTRSILFCLLLALVITSTYWPVRQHDFNNYDDPDYVSQNLLVQEGVTWRGVSWAFSTDFTGNWHPLTWLSHMVDCQLFGPRAGAHLQVNVALHVANAILLFLIFSRMTAAFWPSAVLALLFGLHPMNIESVAWVAERKNLLSALFWMLASWAYINYAERPRLTRYLLVFLLLALGLLAKPLLVTLPCVFLLLDYWPLRRLRLPGSGASSDQAGQPTSAAGRLVLEKIPLFVLCAASSAVAILVAKQTGVVASAEKYPLAARLGNAVVAYVVYLGKMICPENLAVIYPHPGVWPLWQVLGSLVLLFCLSLMVLAFWRSRPYLLVGWLWYLGTLVPMIGLVQVSVQSMANRYAYISFIGLFLMLVWGVRDLVVRWPRHRLILGAAGTCAVVGSLLVTTANLPHWRNSITLFTHALNATTNNPLAHYNLGQALSAQGRVDEPIHHYREAIRLKPDHASAHNNLALSLVSQGDAVQATNHYAQALRLMPENPDFLFNYGICLDLLGQFDAAVGQFRSALRQSPDDPELHVHLARVLMKQNQTNEALHQFQTALELQPEFPDALFYHAQALVQIGQLDQAVAQYSKLISLRPASAEAHAQLGLTCNAQGRTDQAIQHLRQALKLRPDSPETLNNLAWILATDPDPALRNGSDAVLLAERACKLAPGNQPLLLGTLAAAKAEVGEFQTAIELAGQAQTLAGSLGQTNLVSTNQALLQLYRQGKPYRRPPN